MIRRQTSGSVVCPSCGRLVGVREGSCPHCGRANPGLFGFSRSLQRFGSEAGLVSLIIGANVVLYILTLITDFAGVRMSGALSMLAPSNRNLFLFGASGAVPVFGYDRWWTVLSANWLHGGLLHILFNVLWIRQLAPAVAAGFGPGRMILIYLGSGVAGFVLSSVAGAYLVFLPGFLQGAQLTLGASAAVFGLLGAIVRYSQRTGRTEALRMAVRWAGILFLFGFLMAGVDNYAHLGGFLGGYALARWLDPLRPERADHLVAALVGLVLSLLAVVVSVIHGSAVIG